MALVVVVGTGSVTGHTVVDTGMVSVTTAVVCECRGQSGLEGGHDVMVRVMVVQTVEVV